jgi:hypothetical protein
MSASDTTSNDGMVFPFLVWRAQKTLRKKACVILTDNGSAARQWRRFLLVSHYNR